MANASVIVYQNSDEGEVLFNITAFDLAGNSFAVDQTQLNSSNVIIDSSIPGVQSLSVTSNNSNPKVAMAGDAITVTLQVSEQIENSTLQILSTSIDMSVNDDTASANVTVQQNSPNGPVEFTITAYDKTGNVFNVAQDSITDANVVIDTNGPSIVDLTIYSNNANTSLATINNTLNITITANETLKAANITILRLSYVMVIQWCMRRMLFKTVARDVLALLLKQLYIWSGFLRMRLWLQGMYWRFSSLLQVTLMSSDASDLLQSSLFPARSKAVMLNNTSPSSLF